MRQWPWRCSWTKQTHTCTCACTHMCTHTHMHTHTDTIVAVPGLSSCMLQHHGYNTVTTLKKTQTWLVDKSSGSLGMIVCQLWHWPTLHVLRGTVLCCHDCRALIWYFTVWTMAGAWTQFGPWQVGHWAARCVEWRGGALVLYLLHLHNVQYLYFYGCMYV